MAIACLNRAIANFNNFYSAMGGWTSFVVDEEGNCRSEPVTTANQLVTSLDDKEGQAIVQDQLFTFSQILHSLKVVIGVERCHSVIESGQRQNQASTLEVVEQ